MPPTVVEEHNLWDAGYRRIAGVDEVGRGSWAGPTRLPAIERSLQRELARAGFSAHQLWELATGSRVEIVLADVLV